MRNRTSIYGFGDRYTSRCTMPLYAFLLYYSIAKCFLDIINGDIFRLIFFDADGAFEAAISGFVGGVRDWR